MCGDDVANLISTSHLKLGKAPTISVRAKKFEPYVSADQRAVVVPLPGLNQPETMIYYALQELRINFTSQASMMGGNVLGGARADFLLPDYRVVINFNGPFHETSSGKGRDLLVDITYQAAGYRVEVLTDDDLSDLKGAILRHIGRPL